MLRDILPNLGLIEKVSFGTTIEQLQQQIRIGFQLAPFLRFLQNVCMHLENNLGAIAKLWAIMAAGQREGLKNVVQPQ